MGLFSPSKPNEPPKPSPEEKHREELLEIEKIAEGLEASKDILTTTTMTIDRKYEIIGVIFGYPEYKCVYKLNSAVNIEKEQRWDNLQDLKYNAYKRGADAVIGIRFNGNEAYGTAVKFI